MKKIGAGIKKIKNLGNKRVRRDNVSDLSDKIRDIDTGLLASEQAELSSRQAIPAFDRPITYLFKDFDSYKTETRHKIKFIGSLTKEPTARRRSEYMPRALFNRHNLFGYTGLENFGTIVDRYLGESEKEELQGGGGNNGNGILIKNNKAFFDEANVNIDSKNDPRNTINNDKFYYIYSKSKEEGKLIEKYRRNPTAENIIAFFGQDNPDARFHSVEYDWTDFALCKNYGKVPNNHMITLRRFPFPVLDNIYDLYQNKMPDLGRMVTWWGEGTNNSLAEIMKMEWSFVWKELQSEMQVIKSGPPSQSLTDSIFGKNIGNLARITSTINPAGNMFKNTVMQGADFYDFGQHNRMRIDGPVDSIDKIVVRDRGLNFEQKFNLTFEYSLKSLGGINPRLAMLDMLSNILFITYNRGNFWGGGVRYQADLRQARDIAIGDTDLLMKGDYFGYLKSVPLAFQKRFQSLAAGSKSGYNQTSSTIENFFSGILGSFAKPFANIATGIMGNLVDMFFGKAALSSGAFNHMEIPNSLLTNQPVGVWHITVGNPFQPIAVFGNVILEKTSIEFSDNLGYDDFPESFKVVCELKHPIAKDKDSIESVFNVGRGPMYHDPYIFNAKQIQKTISEKGLREYNPYENNFRVADDALNSFKFLSDMASRKFGMNKIVNSANKYYQSLTGNSPGGSGGVLQNQIFGWFLEGDSR